MPNSFHAAPEAPHLRSTAFVETDRPAERLESLMEEAQLHRGSLREQDGYTIPFREGGSVRVRVIDVTDQGQSTGLQLSVDAPTEERRTHIKTVIAEQTSHHAGTSDISWEDEA